MIWSSPVTKIISVVKFFLFSFFCFLLFFFSFFFFFWFFFFWFFFFSVFLFFVLLFLLFFIFSFFSWFSFSFYYFNFAIFPKTVLFSQISKWMFLGGLQPRLFVLIKRPLKLIVLSLNHFRLCIFYLKKKFYISKNDFFFK